MGSLAGHVFVVRGDVTHLACDWWLLPSGTEAGRPGDISETWLGDDRVRAAVAIPGWPDSAPSAEQRAVVVAPPTSEAPGIIGVHTGESGDEQAWWFAEALSAAGRLVLERRDERHLGKRPLRLVALPLIGTGRGGAGERRAGVLEALLERADELARQGVDIALVLANRQAYSAAQRLRVADPRGEIWRRTLDDEEMAVADDLAAHARTGKLVPFLGAGVSAAAGLPGWPDLLATLADPAGLRSPPELEELERMDPRDAARVLQQRMGGPEGRLDGLLRREFQDAQHASLTHALLGSLPIQEAATTNYDRLFENAWGAAVGGPTPDAGTAITVLPRDDASGAARWLLKLHGDVDDDSPNRRLVLSRDEYQRFEQHGGAIAGVLKAMLLTRHLLIVGYGLRDETFHRIAYEVRDIGASQVAMALSERPQPGRQLGTALLVNAPGVFGEVWEDDLHLVDLSGAGEDISTSARRQDVLLDRLGALAAPVESYVLGAGWGELSSHGADEQLKGVLGDLEGVSGLAAPLQRVVDDVLERFGRGEQ